MNELRAGNAHMIGVLLGLVFAVIISAPSMATISAQEEVYELKSSGAHAEIQKAKEAILVDDFATALKILEPLAEDGDPVAQLNLGVMYRRGHGVEKDEEKGIYLYKLSAEQEFAGAQHNLAAVLYNDAETATVRSAAVELFMLAAKQGNQPSIEVIEAMFEQGLKAAKSGKYDIALREWAPLADNGSARAQMNLGTMYSKGDGVDKDAQVALGWYLKAAEQGLLDAQFRVAQMYEDGEGTESKPVKALYWFGRAAKQGDVRSQLIISAALALGEVVPRDAGGALFWAYAAEIEGSQDAEPMVKMLEKAILKKADKSKLQKIKDFVRDCVKKKYEGC